MAARFDPVPDSFVKVIQRHFCKDLDKPDRDRHFDMPRDEPRDQDRIHGPGDTPRKGLSDTSPMFIFHFNPLDP